MTRLSTIAFALILAPILLANSQAAEPLPLEDRMTHREFLAAGLHRLSAEELAALNEFLANEAQEAAPPARQSGSEPSPDPADSPPAQAAPAERSNDDVGFERRQKREAFQAKIEGEFRGWSGDKTRFELSNGQVWEQNQARSFHYSGPPEPTVTFEPGLLGSWYLSVEGYNARVRVRRIE